MQAKTVDDVLRMLGTIVADTTKRRDPLGYFAALYRQVTLRVKTGIDQGYFDDGPRMSRFDAAFANAYFTAYQRYRHHESPGRAWQFAFDRAQLDRTLILQDLLLGINAHINLDLGVTTGKTFGLSALEDFHDDFDRINATLASLIPLARKAVEEFSPRLAELSDAAGSGVVEALEFSVEAARDQAWRAATLVSLTPSAWRSVVTSTLDTQAKLVGRVVADPPEPVGSVVRRVRRAESTDVVAIISALDQLV